MILVNEKEGIYFLFKFSNSLSEIFDYSKKSFQEINTFLEQSTFIASKKNSIIRCDNQSNIENRNGEKLLFHIRKNRNNLIYILENPIPSKLSQSNSDILNLKLWFVINNDKKEDKDNIYKIINKDYFLQKYDIIKFGNIKYIVSELNSKIEHNEDKDEETLNIKNNDYNINQLNKDSKTILDFCPEPKEFYDSPNDKINIICDFCKNYKCNEDNPIIRFCDCNLVHFSCLKNYLKEKIIYKTNNKNVKSYYINGINCKNCNYVYPLKFKSEKYSLIDIKKPTGKNFLILESIEQKMFYGYLKLVHLIELNDKVIKIGRGNNNDIIICDPSISKQHAIIRYNKENGKILLKNISKKFGTSILLKNSLKLNENRIQLQIGKIFLEAQIMKFEDFDKNKDKNTQDPLPKKD